MTDTKNTVSDADWLEDAARYFENRDTGGEDMAFWANVSNAERCRSIAQSLRASIPGGVGVKGLEDIAREFHDGPLMADDHEFLSDSPQGKWCVDVVKFIAERLSALDLSPAEGEVGDGSERAAIEIADAVIAWMVRHDLIDADQEYLDDDIIDVLDELSPGLETTNDEAFASPLAAPSNPVISDEMVTIPRDQIEFVLEALTETRAASIAGCESDGYSDPAKWADRLYRSHGGLTASIKTLTAALSVKPQSGSDKP